MYTLLKQNYEYTMKGSSNITLHIIHNYISGNVPIRTTKTSLSRQDQKWLSKKSYTYEYKIVIQDYHTFKLYKTENPH